MHTGLYQTSEERDKFSELGSESTVCTLSLWSHVILIYLVIRRK